VRLLIRLMRPAAVLGLGILTIWLIVFVFRVTDRRLPTVLALAVTYGIAAYLVLPHIVRMSLKALQRKRVPRFTITGDGLPAAVHVSEVASLCRNDASGATNATDLPAPSLLCLRVLRRAGRRCRDGCRLASTAL
jgi:hypothetical protein